jgi:AraC family transcriptional regulator of adaptative response/methylated-DNA-[protein]-cysteine methyltransferase
MKRTVMELTQDVMYNAIIEKDTSFEGLFFTAVKTTGIFCRPSCTARKPKLENVEFLKTSKDCMLKGYRPCKVCRPLENLHETPVEIKNLLEELHADPALKFKDCDLKQRGIESHSLRRWFLKNHGVTFQAYQRMFRINSAFKKIKNGEGVTHTAFGTGYESLSGFGDSFKNIFGVSPKNSKAQRVIDLTRFETPLGTMYACAVEEGICLLEFTDRKMLETKFKTLSKTLNAIIVQGKNIHFEILEQQLSEYFKGDRRVFSVPLFTPGTDFQNIVWKALQQIPFGSTRTYKDQALDINKPESVRAVANANGMNRISILVPCHRVVGADGNLTGYGGGVWRKQWLLDMEKNNL